MSRSASGGRRILATPESRGAGSRRARRDAYPPTSRARRRRRRRRPARPRRQGRRRRRAPPGCRGAGRTAGARASGRVDDDGHERGVERARERRRPPDRPDRRRAAVDEDQDAIGHERQLLARDRVLELALDAPGHQPQAQLAQRGQVRLREEPVEGDLRALGRVDVAVLHPLPQRVRAHVDELDLVRGQQHVVGEALVDRGAGDRRDGVGHARDVLDVHRGHDVDARVADDLDVLPALGPCRARDVGVGELVDERDGRPALEDGDGVHLLDHDAAVLDRAGAGRPRGRRAARACAAARAPRRSRRRRRCPARRRRWPSSSIR